MFIKVKLLNNLPESLLYTIPEEWNSYNLQGSIVKVPLRNKSAYGFIQEFFPVLGSTPVFKIKQALAIEPFPNDESYNKFINELSNYYQTEPIFFIKRIKQFITQNKKQVILNENPDSINNNVKEIILTQEQEKVVSFLMSQLADPKYSSTLLHGVTGSGKTEVYKKLIIQNYNHNKTTLLLLPEVTLALQFEDLLTKSLPSNIPIFNFHSASKAAQKKELWQSLISNKPILIIGVHLPVLLPIENLGLIIVDEEHEAGYQEKKHPKINTKEAAILKASLKNIPILLGSATPSISSLYNVKNKGWNFFQLKQRFGGNFPSVEIVNLLDKKQRPSFWISTKLQNMIRDKISKKEQAIIFLNRRGFSFYIQCSECDYIFKCNNCSVSLILHSDNCLYCHYCALKIPYPKLCNQCKKSNDNFLKRGIGTQQVVQILQSLFPAAVIARADLDSTLKKREWNETVRKFKNGGIDILVGTQTITKGYHFPKVTLVGILWADLNLHFPVYNASETVLQQLIQVAGRAGRQCQNSNVIVQTMVDHQIFDFINEIDYLKFYQSESASRKENNYPPFTRFVEIEFKYKDETVLQNEVERFFEELNINLDSEDIQLLGPVAPIISKIKNIFMRKIYVKGKSLKEINKLYAAIDKDNYKSEIYFTPNPLS